MLGDSPIGFRTHDENLPVTYRHHGGNQYAATGCAHSSDATAEPLLVTVMRPLIEGGLVGTTASLDAEALYSARDQTEYEQLWADRRAAYEYLPTNDEHWQIALGAQRGLAATGRHRAVGIADLLTATLAAAHRLTVVHYDADFDTAATLLTFEHAGCCHGGVCSCIHSKPPGDG
jgi:predicted nucleic acid-binding protein